MRKTWTKRGRRLPVIGAGTATSAALRALRTPHSNGPTWAPLSSGSARRRRVAGLVFVACFLATGLRSQAWLRMQLTNSPLIPGGFVSMVYDSVNQRTVLLGGSAPATWVLDPDNTWTPLSVSPAPTATWAHAMTYDRARAKTVMFGGAPGSGGISSETWEWDGSGWAQILTPASPPPRTFHAIAWDALRNRTVLFGGYSGSGPSTLGDTWEYDGSTWTQQFPTTAPSARLHLAMAYDESRGKTVLYGGADVYGNGYGDTWEWDGLNWSQVAPVYSPGGRLSHSMTYDPSRQRVVMLGGVGDGTSDLWEFDGLTWQARYAGPPRPGAALWGFGFTFDTQNQTLVEFFVDETWEFRTLHSPSQTTMFGTPCSGSLGGPGPTLTNTTPPNIGEDLHLMVSVPLFVTDQTGCLVVLGVSNTSWGSQPLPADLAYANMPGCFQYVSADFWDYANVTQGLAPWSVPIPWRLSLLGVSIYGQAVVPTSRTSNSELITTNGLAITIGCR